MVDTNIWIGGAQAVAQQLSHTLVNTRIGTIWTVAFMGKTVSITAVAASDSLAAAALVQAWNSSTEEPARYVRATASGNTILFTSLFAGHPIDALTVTASGVTSPPIDEVQAFTIDTATSDGTYTLTFTYDGDTATTDPLPWNANAATVQDALEALPTIGTGNVAVSSSTPGVNVVSFAGGELAGKSLEKLAATSHFTALASVAAVQTKYGGYGTDCEKKITLPPQPFDGSYVLIFGGVTSGLIPWNATPGEVQTALRAMSSINGPYVDVTGTAGAEYHLTFTGELGAQSIGPLSSASGVLTHPTVSAEFAADGSEGADATQVIVVPQLDAIGTWTMRFGGYTTQPLDCSANAAVIQSALQSLTSIGPGNILIGTTSTSGRYTATFTGDKRQSLQAAIAANVYWAIPLGLRCITTVVGVHGEHAVQKLVISGANSGSFSLTFGGSTATGIAWNATSAEVQTALCTLTGVGAGNCGVTEEASGVHVIRFTGSRVSSTQEVIQSGNGTLAWTPSIVVERDHPGTTGHSAEFTISLSNDVTGGTFTISVDGYTTDPQYAPAPNLMQASLEALPSVGTGNCTIGGGVGPGQTTVIGLAGNKHRGISVDFSQVEGGTGSCVVTEAGKDPANEQQTIGFASQRADGGTWAVIYSGSQSDWLQWNAPAGTVQSALENIQAIGTGNVVVMGGPGPAMYYVGFTGTLGNSVQGLLGTVNNLTYSSSDATANVFEVIRGFARDSAEQRLYYVTQPVTGTYALTFGGNTTSNLNWDATAYQVRVALEALPSIGATNVTVTGDAASGWAITFANSMRSQPVATIGVLTGGLKYGAPAITITPTEDGGPGENCIQELSADVADLQIDGSYTITGGSYTITFDGQTTAALAYNATSYAVQAALENLSNIGGGNVAVTGLPLYAGVLRVEFKADRGFAEQSRLVVSSDLLTAEPLTIQTTVEGLAGICAKQQIAMVSGASCGTWTLSFSPANEIVSQGVALNWNCTLPEVQAALDSLPTLGANVATATSPGNGTFIVTFGGPYAGVDVPLLNAVGHIVGGNIQAVTSQYGRVSRGQSCVYNLSMQYGGGYFWVDRWRVFTRSKNGPEGGRCYYGASAAQVKEAVKWALESTNGSQHSTGGRSYYADVEVTREEFGEGTGVNYVIEVFAYDWVDDPSYYRDLEGSALYVQNVTEVVKMYQAEWAGNTGASLIDKDSFYGKGVPRLEFGTVKGPVSGGTGGALETWSNPITWEFGRRDGHPDINNTQSLKIYRTKAGSYTLTFDGQTTAPIDVAANCAQVQSALASLSTIGTGQVLVELNPLRWADGNYGLWNKREYLIQFTGTKSLINQPMLTAEFVGTPTPMPIPLMVNQSKDGIGDGGRSAIFDVVIGTAGNGEESFATLYLFGSRGIEISKTTTAADITAAIADQLARGVAPSQCADIVIVDRPSRMEGLQLVLVYRVFLVGGLANTEFGTARVPCERAVGFVINPGSPAWIACELVQYGYSGRHPSNWVYFGGLSTNLAVDAENAADLINTDMETVAGMDLAPYTADQLRKTYSPASGTWTLMFCDIVEYEGQRYDTTGDMAILQWNYNAAQIQAALEALPSIGVGNVIVTGNPLVPPIDRTADDMLCIDLVGDFGDQRYRKQWRVKSYLPIPGANPRITVDLHKEASPAENTKEWITVQGFVTNGSITYAVQGDHHKEIDIEWPFSEHAGDLWVQLASYYGPDNVTVTTESPSAWSHSVGWEFDDYYKGKPVKAGEVYGADFAGPKPYIAYSAGRDLVRGLVRQQPFRLPCGVADATQVATWSEFTWTISDSANTNATSWGRIYSDLNGFTAPVTINSATTAEGLNAQLGGRATFSDLGSTSSVKRFHAQLRGSQWAVPIGWDDVFLWIADSDTVTFTGENISLGSPAGWRLFSGGTFTMTFNGHTTMALPLVYAAQENGNGGYAFSSLGERARQIQHALEEIPALTGKIYVYPGQPKVNMNDDCHYFLPGEHDASYEYGAMFTIKYKGDLAYDDSFELIKFNCYVEDPTLAPVVTELYPGRPRESAEQTLTVVYGGTAPTSGTWAITYGGTTTAMNWNVTAAEATAALQSIHGTGAMVFSGGPFPSSPLTLTFGGSLAYDYQDAVATTSTMHYETGADAIDVAVVTRGSLGTYTTVLVVVANEGPSCWNIGDNWSLGAPPVDGQAVAFTGSVAPMLYGFPTEPGLHLARIVVDSTYGGAFGPVGVAVTPVIGADEWILGAGDGDGCPWFRAHVSESVANQKIVIHNTGSPIKTAMSTRAVELTGGNSTSTVEIRKGKVGIATDAGARASFAAVTSLHSGTPKSDVDLQIGQEVTLPILQQYGGEVRCMCDVGAWTQAGGKAYNLRGTVGTIVCNGGTFFLYGSGPVGSLTIGADGVVDTTGGAGTVHVTTYTIAGGLTLEQARAQTKDKMVVDYLTRLVSP